MGFWEVLCHLHTILVALHRMKAVLRERRPGMLVLVDYAGFNIKLALYAKKLGIKVFYYVSPKVWVWKRGRLDVLAKCVDMMAVLHAFEVPLYQKKGIPVAYVGHYLTDDLRSFVRPHPVSKDLKRCSIALLPGSRSNEIKVLMPVLMSVAKALHARYPDIRFVLIQAEFLPADVFSAYFANYHDLPIEVVVNDHRKVLADCDLALACSGTVTLELGILGIPTIVLYRVASMSYCLIRCLTAVRTTSLVNLIAKRDIFTELLQDEMTYAKVLQAAKHYLEDATYYHAKINELDAFQQSQQEKRENVANVFSRVLANGHH
jgi:lipid-A-disaccharide synthase